MRISVSVGKQAQPLMVPSGGGSTVKINCTNLPRQKDKVVVVMGATGTGKSRLSIDLAKRFPAEIINSDKMQVYEGLDIVTNKVTNAEQRGVPHHLLGTQNPNSDFTVTNFCDKASFAIESILGRGQLPIIVGGSNSYLEALLDDDDYKFRSRYDLCFLWIDVSMPILHSFVSERVDQMVENGMINELKLFCNPTADYSRGIRKAIGITEFDRYFQNEGIVNEETRKRLFLEAISEVKDKTCKLASKQFRKINRLRNMKKWEMNRLEATQVFKLRKHEKEANEAWEKLVAMPCAMVVAQFLYSVSTDVSVNIADLRLPAMRTAIATVT
ncbi:Adenylate isopentenyltransferase [Quillaja saponaria]|uniref:adenylate dimethylallyltransferase (ADP/ATP-dependent) n=1 Tax=Quillaja saponaria TaxID=32244 RepID=A0AAD7Q9Y6_QUISA|nr:Adenylate isopentenyltransferase [Quillaja saponaria]